MGKDVKIFNELCKGRCRDKFLAMRHICNLSDLQYNILIEKFCSGRNGLSRTELAEKYHKSERTIDREYEDTKNRIFAILDKYKQSDFAGDFFFYLDEKITGYDWSKVTGNNQ